MSADAAFDAWPHLTRLAAEPGDVDALAALDDGLMRLAAESGASAPVANLRGSMANLLGRLLDGAATPSAATARLLAEAWAALPEADDAAVGDIVERLDAVASGLEPAFGGGDGQPSARTDEPPLLTVRHDGSPVLLGGFEDDEPVGDGQTAPGEGDELAPVDPAAVAAALGLAGERLRDAIGALQAAAGADLAPFVAELSAAADDIERLRDALAAAVGGAR